MRLAVARVAVSSAHHRLPGSLVAYPPLLLHPSTLLCGPAGVRRGILSPAGSLIPSSFHRSPLVPPPLLLPSQTCWGTPWNSASGRYQPNEDAPPVPPALIQLSRELVSEAHGASPVFRNGKTPQDFNPDACLVNFYPVSLSSACTSIQSQAFPPPF